MIYWKDWKGDCFTDGDRYFYHLEDFVDHILAGEDEALLRQAAASPLNLTDLVDGLPSKVWDCVPEYSSFRSAQAVARNLFRDFRQLETEWGGHRQKLMREPPLDAEQLGDSFIEDVYENVEEEIADYSLKDLKELQAALDRFALVNRPLWYLLGDRPWFKPDTHSIGLKRLQRALDAAAIANRHHFIYVKGTAEILLDGEFWKAAIIEIIAQEDAYQLRRSKLTTS